MILIKNLIEIKEMIGQMFTFTSIRNFKYTVAAYFTINLNMY